LERRCFSHHDGHQPSHLNCPPPEITQAGRWFKDDDGSSLLIFLKNIWEKPLAKTWEKPMGKNQWEKHLLSQMAGQQLDATTSGHHQAARAAGSQGMDPRGPSKRPGKR